MPRLSMLRSGLWVFLACCTVVLAGCHEEMADDGPAEEPSYVDQVSVLFAPAGAAKDSEVDICWSVAGGGTIAHTAIHWAAEPGNASTATFEHYSLGARYPDNRSAAASGGYEVPGEFCTAFTMPDFTVYLVAHAIGERDGPPGRLSAERMIQIA